jgi:hypothetical protein
MICGLVARWDEHPMSGGSRTDYSKYMKEKIFFQNQSQKPAGMPDPIRLAAAKQDEIDFVPSPDEVARKAYFSFVNEGSPPGRDVQHWLAAEAELIAERNRTRVHGFHNRT